MQLSKDQTQVLDNLLDWHKTKQSDYITLGGYAGTGKTTLISVFREKLSKEKKKKNVLFCSYTGKATRILKNKLKEQKSLEPGDDISTIHSSIYSPVKNSKDEIVGWDRKEKLDYDLIIIDEASMVDEDIWRDLKSYKIPIIAVGDHGQLPPIKGQSNLMENPELKLENIHRQAKDNPIIQLSIRARKYGEIPQGYYSPKVFKIKKSHENAGNVVNELIENYTDDTLLLCGFNNTRVKLNEQIRYIRELFDPKPQQRDRVICLKNNHSKEIFNGMTGTIKSVEKDTELTHLVKIDFDGEKKGYTGIVYAEQFGNPENIKYADGFKNIPDADLFDYGYALTVHKAQGSQAKKVILFEERSQYMDDDTWRRWLYTGVTRAEEELYIVGK